MDLSGTDCSVLGRFADWGNLEGLYGSPEADSKAGAKSQNAPPMAALISQFSLTYKTGSRECCDFASELLKH